MIERLIDCFKEDFTEWLLKSNCPDVGPFTGDWWLENWKMRIAFNKIQKKSLKDILDILQREPEADYFWYTSQWKHGKLDTEHGRCLTYSLPSSELQAVRSDSLRVDKEKIKALLRDIKIETILND